MEGNKKQVFSSKNFTKLERNFEMLRTALAILISLGLVFLIVSIISDEPIQAIRSLVLGPISTTRRFGNVIELMIPLSFTGLAMSIIFSSKRFNLVSDSAFYLGSMVAAFVAINSNFSPVITIILSFVIAITVGAVLGFIPAVIKEKFGANELVISLMLNYIIGFYVKYLFNYKVRDLNISALQSLPIKEGNNLTVLVSRTRIHSGIIIIAVLLIISWLVMYKTKWGYAIRATGANENFATYSGMKVGVIVLSAQAIGTAIASLGGAVEMLGMHSTFKWLESPGYGFDGVIIATLARNNPLYVPIGAFFLSYIRVGADILNRSTDIPAEIMSIVQATIILLIAGKAFLAKRKQKAIVKQAQKMEDLQNV